MANPSEVTDRYWIYAVNPAWRPIGRFVGMWAMVLPAGELDTTWEIIKEAVATGKLPAARARTGMPNLMGLDERHRVICVATWSAGNAENVREEIRNLGIHRGVRYHTIARDSWNSEPSQYFH